MSRARSAKANQQRLPYLLRPAHSAAEEPIPFVTARRFWILVYMLAGTTGIAMLVARFLVRPIMLKVQNARQEYQRHICEQLKSLVANMTKSITTLPGRQIIVDTDRHRLYVNTETQTDDADLVDSQLPKDESTSPELTVLSKLATRLRESGQEEEEKAYIELSSKMSDLRTYLYELESTSYKSSYVGFRAGSAGSSSEPGAEAMQKVKAEIRSVKGSLLNARAFTSIQNGRKTVATTTTTSGASGETSAVGDVNELPGSGAWT